MLPRAVPHFTGRERELARVAANLEEFSLVLIEGAPGSGKTALALELANRLDAGPLQNRVLWTRAQEGWRCESLLYSLSAAWPRVAGTEMDPTVLDGTVALNDRFVLLAEAVNRSGLCLFLDDFHRVEDGVELLGVLREYVRGAPVVVTTRERVPLRALEELDVLAIRLEGLPDADARDLILRLVQLDEWKTEENIARLLSWSRGHPLLIKLLISLIHQNRLPPDDPGHLFAPLLDDLRLTLSQEEQDLMNLLAVAGYPVDLASLGHQHEPILASLQRRFLVDQGPGPAYSTHDVFGDYFRARLDPAVRRELHRRCSDLLLAAYDRDRDLDTARLTIHHLVQGGRMTQAADLLQEAQVRLFQAAQYDYLMEWIPRLSEHSPEGRTRLLITRADILAVLGRTRESLDLLLQAEREGSEDERIQAINSRCHLVLEQGFLDESCAVAGESIRLLEQARGRRPGRVKAFNGIALAQARRGNPEEARRWAARSIEHAEAIGDRRGLAYAHYARALSYWHQDLWEEGLRAARDSLAACRHTGETRLGFLARYLEGTALLALDRREEASQILESSLADSARYPDPLSRAMAELGWARLQLSLEGVQRALDYGQQHGGRVFLAQVHLVKASLEEEAGDLKQAAATLDRGLELAREAGAFPFEADMAIRRELLQPEPDLAGLERLRARAEDQSLHGLELRARLARCCRRLQEGRLEEARLLLNSVDFRPSSDDRAMLEFLATLAGGGAGRSPGGCWQPVASRLSDLGQRPFVVHTRQGVRRLSEGEVEAIRANRDRFDLWIDLGAHVVVERTRGELPLLRRKVLTRLLLYLIRSYPTPRSQEEVFLEVWGPPYHHEESDAQVRKSVSALRDLLEVDRAHPRYIQVAEGVYGTRGGYLLGSEPTYCVIEIPN
ncbi:MAG: AAA family ATPase [Candidatus Eremiobacterota bacterium]